MKTEQTLTSAVNARMSPFNRLLSRTVGQLIIQLHPEDAFRYKSPALSNLFTNPYTRREIYHEAHADDALAARIKVLDPFYAERAQLTPLQKRIRHASERILFVPLAGMEGIIGGPLDLIEGKFFKGRRTRVGQLFDDFMYIFSDMFHGKRILYTLP
jgi:hypothetical protein